MKPDQLKQAVVTALEDVKGRHIVALDVRELTGMTDYMVVATGTSNRHVKALAENVSDELRKQGLRPIGTEGDDVAEWVLVDYGDVVVHVMLAEARAFYDLERLWSDGEMVAPEHPEP
jgi:ribosome-associated protein